MYILFFYTNTNTEWPSKEFHEWNKPSSLRMGEEDGLDEEENTNNY